MKGASLRSAVLLGVLVAANLGLTRSRGNYSASGLYCYGLVLLGLFVAFALGVWPLERWKRPGFLDARLWQVLIALVLVGICRFQVDQQLFMYADQAKWGPVLGTLTRLATALALVPLALAAFSFWRSPDQRWAGIALTLVVAPILVLYLLAPIASPRPAIDVFYVQTESVEALLLSGRNPYTVEYTNIYGDTPWYPSGRADSYPYPPLSIFVAALGYLDGDVRRALIVCHVGAALLLFLTARKKGLVLVESATLALLFLYLPYGPFISEQAWTDPSVALGFGLVSWFLAGSRQMAALWAAGFVIALKQTMIFIPPLVWGLWRRFDVRQLVALFAISAMTYGGFALWDAGALFDDVVRFHSLTPFRRDGLTLSSYLVERGGQPLPSWLAWAGLAGGAGLTSLLLRKTSVAEGEFQPDRVLLFFLGAGLTFLLVLLLSKHAFLNYFYLLHYFLLLALVWTRIADEQESVILDKKAVVPPAHDAENTGDKNTADTPFPNEAAEIRHP